MGPCEHYGGKGKAAVCVTWQECCLPMWAVRACARQSAPRVLTVLDSTELRASCRLWALRGPPGSRNWVVWGKLMPSFVPFPFLWTSLSKLPLGLTCWNLEGVKSSLPSLPPHWLAHRWGRLGKLVLIRLADGGLDRKIKLLRTIPNASLGCSYAVYVSSWEYA